MIRSRKEALETLTGKQRGITSGLEMGYDAMSLSIDVDLDQSIIEPRATSATEFVTATSKAKNEEQKEFTFGQDTLKVKSLDVIMSLDSTNSQLRINLNIWTQEDL